MILSLLNPRALNKCDVYIALWCLYFLQGVLYPVGGFVSQSLLMGLLVYSLYFLFYANSHYVMPSYYKGLNALLGIFICYGVFMLLIHGSKIYSPMGQSIVTKNYLQIILSSFLPLYPLYVFAKEGLLTTRRMRVWTILFFIVATACFFREERERLNRLILEGSQAEEVTNNSGYTMLTLIPLLVLFKRWPIIQYIGMGFIMYFVTIAMKRGAIIVGVLCLVYFLYSTFRNSSPKTKFGLILLTCCIAYIGSAFISDYAENSAYMQSRIEDTKAGNTSGRDVYYKALWNHFLTESGPVEMIIGNGAEGAFYSVGYIAHNDWLEILLGQGLLGVLIYIIYWTVFLKAWKNALNPDVKIIIGIVFLIFFTKTFFSMSYQTMTIYSNAILALCLSGNFNNEE